MLALRMLPLLVGLPGLMLLIMFMPAPNTHRSATGLASEGYTPADCPPRLAYDRTNGSEVAGQSDAADEDWT